MNNQGLGLIGKMSDGVKRTLVLANEEVVRLRQDEIAAEHLLAGVLRLENVNVMKFLERAGFDPSRVESELSLLLTHGTTEYSVPDRIPEEPVRLWTIPFSIDAKAVFGEALSKAAGEKRDRIEIEHLVAALTESKSDSMLRIFSRSRSE